MTKPEKYRLLLLMAGVILLLLLLAAGVTQIQMQPGDPFSFALKQPDPTAVGTLGGGSWILVLIRGFLILCVITIPIYIFVNLLTPKGRRRLLRGLIQLLVLSVFLFILASVAESFTKRNQEQEQEKEPFTIGEGMENTGEVAGAEEQVISNPPAWLDAGICLGIAFILAVLITVLAWGIYRASRQATGHTLTRLAEEAQDAADALLSGENIRDTVIRCYIQMTKVIANERNVRREEDMTPHEFEQVLLEKMKLPEFPVQRLTRLFEAVRYGDYHPGKREELEAIDSLTAIAAACKSVRA